MTPLDDIAAITRLKYRYLRFLDTKQWDDFASCFAPDATADYNGLLFEDPVSWSTTCRPTWAPAS